MTPVQSDSRHIDVPRPSASAAATAQIAVLGCGYWGRNLVRVFHSLQALRVVCEPAAAQIEIAKSLAPGVSIKSQLADVLGDPLVKAVVIATPAETHARIASAALAAGKHVFVEKPLALNYREGLGLVQQATAAGLVLMVGHILEYHPAVVELIRRGRSGSLGKIQYIYSNRLNLGKVRKEENILWSFAPHDIAVMLRIVGTMPIEVSATGGTYLQPAVADVTVTNLLFEDGVRGHIFVSWLHPYKEQRLVVVGSKAMAVFDDVSQDRKLAIYDQGIDWIEGKATPRRNGIEVVDVPADEPLREEAVHFLQAVSSGTRPLTDGESGLNVLRVLQSAQRSLLLNGRPVAVGGHDGAGGGP